MVFIYYFLGHQGSWQAPKPSGQEGTTLLADHLLQFQCLLLAVSLFPLLPETLGDFFTINQVGLGPLSGS